MRKMVFETAMRKIYKIAICTCVFLFFNCQPDYREERIPKPSVENEKRIRALYKECHLKGKVRFDIFRRAIIGYSHINCKNKDYVTIVDYSKPSTKKRLFVINLKKKKIQFSSFVSHGKNTGKLYAKHFSNTRESKKSSLGFYRTAQTYDGKYGYSLRLDGLEKGINHNARKRAIVIHGASYASLSFIEKHGMLGRSWGCPAIPPHLKKTLIDTIKNGSCLYIHADNDAYMKNSKYIAG